MIMCLSAGNTNIFGGLFHNDKIVLRFRHATTASYTADQFGLFLRALMRENEIDYKSIKKISVCSVVPGMDYSLRAACVKYFNIEPFWLTYNLNMGLKVDCQTEEIGADRLANAIAAIHLYPNKNLIIASFGTATTVDVIKKDKTYLSGAILPGFRISMEALMNNTAKLPGVEIVKPKHPIGTNTIENIQSGLYYSQLGAVTELTKKIIEEVFADESPVIIATGGFSSLFQACDFFHRIEPDLILLGAKLVAEAAQ